MLNRYPGKNRHFGKIPNTMLRNNKKKLLLDGGPGIWKEKQQIGKDEGFGVSKG